MKKYAFYWFVIVLLWVSLVVLVFEKSTEFEDSLFNMHSSLKKIGGILPSGFTVSGGDSAVVINYEIWLRMCQGDVITGSHYLLIPNCESTPVSGVDGLDSYFIKINSDGFRGREYTVDKPDNTFRIVVLGDSFTFGQGFNIEDTFCYRLERMLNENHPEKSFEVLNFGVPAINTAQEVEHFKEKALKYSPDLIIIGFIGNDDENPEVNLLFNDFRYKNFTREEWNIEYKKIKNNRTLKNIEFIKKPFEELISFSEKFGFPILVYAFGVESYQDKFLTDLERSYDGFYFQKASFNFRGSRKFYLHPLDLHPSALANEMYAQEIYDTINRYNLLHP